MVLPSFSAPFEGRPFLIFPVLDGIFVSLVGQTLGLLQREPELGQQSAHMSWMVSEPKFLAKSPPPPSHTSTALLETRVPQLPELQARAISLAHLHSEVAVRYFPRKGLLWLHIPTKA
jgi:hypothetical protein